MWLWFLVRDKFLVYKADLGRTAHDRKAQNTISAFTRWAGEDLNDVGPI